MKTDARISDKLAQIDELSDVFDELSPAEETFVRVFVDQGNLLAALAASGLGDSQYKAVVVAERILRKPHIVQAVDLYRGWRESRPPKKITIETIVTDLRELHSLCLVRGDLRIALKAKEMELAIILGMEDAKAGRSA